MRAAVALSILLAPVLAACQPDSPDGYRPLMIEASSSMLPTLRERQVVGVVRYWDGATPQPGDIIAFRLPRDESTHYIKRLIGLPGDRVQIAHGELILNGQAVPRERLADYGTIDLGGRAMTVRSWRETLPNGVAFGTLDFEEAGAFDNTETFEVPPASYFVLGDNRDNSTDSRLPDQVGFVPAANVIGKVLPP